MLNWFARRMKEARKDEQGFTLIELLVVIIIIGILAAIAIPTFLSQREKGVQASIKSDVKQMVTAQTTRLSSNQAIAAGTFTTATPVREGNATSPVLFTPSANVQLVVAQPAGGGADDFTVTGTSVPATRAGAGPNGGVTYQMVYNSQTSAYTEN